MARGSPYGDVAQGGADFHGDVDRRASRALQKPQRALGGVAEIVVDQAPPVVTLDPAAAVRNHVVDDRQHEAELGIRSAAQLGRLPQQRLVVTGAEAVHCDVPRDHPCLSLLVLGQRSERVALRIAVEGFGARLRAEAVLDAAILAGRHRARGVQSHVTDGIDRESRIVEANRAQLDRLGDVAQLHGAMRI